MIRLHGYENLPLAPPLARLLPVVRSERQESLDALRHRVAALDYQEAITFSFVDREAEHGLIGQRRAHQAAQSDCKPSRGDTFRLDRQSVWNAAA